jgi:LuxR family transcriptional regulator
MFVDRSRIAGAGGSSPETGAVKRERARPRDPLAIDFDDIAPAGHYLALRVSYAFPVEEVNRLPRDWVELYTRAGFFMKDPMVRWVHSDSGCCRWSALPFQDVANILGLAREHGLAFGAAVSHVSADGDGFRSYGFFGRGDREYSEEELERLLAYIRARHDAMAPPRNITAAEIEALRLIKQGQRLKQIAYQLGVTEGAVKQRLKNARLKLSAKTGAEAISRAKAFGLI